VLRAIVFIFFAFVFTSNLFAQNRIFAQKIIDTLASKAFFGRGYVNNGDAKAALYLSEQFKGIGLKSFIKNNAFLYSFSFPVNTFPGKCKISLDGKKLIPGKDFIVNPGCKSIGKSLKIQAISDHKSYPLSQKNTALLYDTSYKFEKHELTLLNNYNLKISLQKKLTWSVSANQDNTASIEILKTSFPLNAKKIKVKIDAKLIDHTAYNLIGFMEGTEIKDTFIVLTAHYDHLGMMGKATMFPGANDNASGVAMMLDMATYFSKHPSKYSMVFIAFAGEEAGLIGSKHYTDNPLDKLPLTNMKFLINLDLMGSGEKGMAVVNATIYPDFFNKLKAVNSEKRYLPVLKMRGKAANSDHYWFSERGVKGFFFYLMGDYSHYHDIDDNRDNLRLGEYYDKSFLLIRDFIETI